MAVLQMAVFVLVLIYLNFNNELYGSLLYHHRVRASGLVCSLFRPDSVQFCERSGSGEGWLTVCVIDFEVEIEN